IWDTGVENVAWEDGCARRVDKGAGESEPLSLKAIAAKRAVTGGPIGAEVSVNAGGVAPGFAAEFCDVEVDPETGKVKVLRFVAAQDVGRAIHPSYVEGQMQGGAAQGIGWALNEEHIYDKAGHLENPGFLDYRVPVASDLPRIDTVLVEVPNPNHPFGAKGVGEANFVPSIAAVANAVSRAVGRRMNDLPMSPPKILRAIDVGRGG
ncbi:MAG: xanthine dehydrogenase family protein molybdopterin-binding subunit, partial [Deltaproteobacteria bacterium]|nr:xanthine dehydrogenase family protein molybdopterin-binding subunit [Deltaproteobacteria bacterium]